MFRMMFQKLLVFFTNFNKHLVKPRLQQKVLEHYGKWQSKAESYGTY